MTWDVAKTETLKAMWADGLSASQPAHPAPAACEELPVSDRAIGWHDVEGGQDQAADAAVRAGEDYLSTVTVPDPLRQVHAEPDRGVR